MASQNSINSGLSNIKESADGLLKSTVNAFQKAEPEVDHKMHTLSTEMSEKLNDTIKFAEEEYGYLTQQLNQFAKKGYGVMKRNPALTLLGVAAVGFMAAKVFQSYSRTRSTHGSK